MQLLCLGVLDITIAICFQKILYITLSLEMRHVDFYFTYCLLF